MRPLPAAGVPSSLQAKRQGRARHQLVVVLVHPLEHPLQRLARQLALHHALADGHGAAVVAVAHVEVGRVLASLR